MPAGTCNSCRPERILVCFASISGRTGDVICEYCGDYMAVARRLAADAGDRLGRRMAHAAIVALTGVSLLVATPSDSFGGVAKREARHSRHAVASAVRYLAAQRLRAKNLALAKLVAATAQGNDEAAVPGRAAPPHSA